MLNSARHHLARQCTCSFRAVSPVWRTPLLAASPSTWSRSSNLSTTRRVLSDDLPWFVDPASAPASSSTSTSSSRDPRSNLATAPVPTRPPAHLASSLHPLHAHLSVSPFFDKDSLTYIHAREADPTGTWCDWVVLCTLKEGRERSLRGAVEGVRTYLAANPVELDSIADLDESSVPAPFSPPVSNPAIHGLPPTTPSKHARSRARRGPPPTRQDQASGWALLDAGTLVVHVMTREARVEYGNEIERVWRGVAKEEGVETRRDALERAERERELQENLESVRKEMEAEQQQQQQQAR
ncbi:hypothetical protein JCM10212_004051 [Sporobolomyces blumeae]